MKDALHPERQGGLNMQRAGHDKRKVVVVGAGAVGSTFAYALLGEGIADEIVMTDLNRGLAEGQVLDLAHGLPFVPPVAVRVGDAGDYADASVIVITAGAKQRPGETRPELLRRNVLVVNAIMAEIAAQGSPAVVVIVTNPVDLLTRTAIQATGWDNGRVFGSGTVLDSARLRYLISRSSGINVQNIHAYVLGEHGDSQVAAWSITNIAGMPIDRYCPLCGVCPEGQWKEHKERLIQEVRQSAYHIIDYKGATNFAVGLALVRIVGAVLRNERRILTVSTLLTGQYGMDDVCLSVPCLVSARGVERIVEMDLAAEDLAGLQRSGQAVRAAIRSLGDNP